MWNDVGGLAAEAVRLNMRMAENAMALTLATSRAWAETWDREYREAGATFDAHVRGQARAVRLVRRGVPPVAAARALRAL